MELRCVFCGTEINENDNFCFKCGRMTAKGKETFKDKKVAEKTINGAVVRQSDNIISLLSMILFFLVSFAAMSYFRGNNFFKPLLYLKKQVSTFMYGYNTSVINSKNMYINEEISSLDEAKSFIRRDFDNQIWKCYTDMERYKLTTQLEDKYDISSISFCDISYDETLKIKEVIDKIYLLFPNIKGALTNISITNAETNSEYIAYFQEMYQFVNAKNNIDKFNKINKTQILLNSYYFLNDDILAKPLDEVLKDNLYVSDATFESTIAHEFGHYIVFKAYLKENNIDNITFITKDNEKKIMELIENYDNGSYAEGIVTKALRNYNSSYGVNVTIEQFTNMISRYASTKDKDGIIIYNETIAEAVHDYYLHGDSMSNASSEIIKILKSKLR